MTGIPMEVGRVVRSRAGRDEGRLMMVVAVEDATYVRVADGDLRKLERPKRKKVKHLRPTPLRLDGLAQRMGASQALLDADIRKALQEAGTKQHPSTGKEG